MNNKMRRILALVLALILACSMLTACGSSEEASENGVKKVKVGVINTGTAETMAWTRAHKEGVDYLKEKIDTLVDTEVAEVARMEAVAAFLAKPVTITDGYRKAEYDSWSSYLLKRIHERSLSDWNVNRMIRDEVDKRVKRIWEECESKARAVAVAAFSEGIESLFSKEAK